MLEKSKIKKENRSNAKRSKLSNFKKGKYKLYIKYIFMYNKTYSSLHSPHIVPAES